MIDPATFNDPPNTAIRNHYKIVQVFDKQGNFHLYAWDIDGLDKGRTFYMNKAGEIFSDKGKLPAPWRSTKISK